ncbi:hypothetical protein GCM10009860_13190 [Microbacterium mitrae]|uniref:YfhO family protein n=1 Tax=Microbacterium mitrae TaxID=664640 RepID=A0A5C8HU42_9MICO|nr:YfhO family protein [Microbacterium mitrae]TXK06613.1 YfhO family protein [Microbacterium mitrae]
MAQAPKSNKKVVRVESAKTSSSGSSSTPAEATWKPTAEAKKKAMTFRIIAFALWILAIAGEAFTIFYVLRQVPVKTWLLIVLIVVIGLLAIGGSLLWKNANKLDPASRKDTVRFFVQNQLGLIMTIIAFLPMIVLVFTNKNMDGKQKALAGTIGIIVALVAGYFGYSQNAPSVEQYTAETGIVQAITGEDLVYWTTSGKVYHLCQAASDVNMESKDNTIHSGTSQDARDNGKERLTLQLDSELKECGYVDYVLPENWKAVIRGEDPFVAEDWPRGALIVNDPTETTP